MYKINMRRKIVALVLSVLLGLFVFGLTGVYGSEKTQTLEIWDFSTRTENIVRGLAPDFEKEHPNVKINVTRMGIFVLGDKLFMAFKTGIGAPDIIAYSPSGSFLEGPVEEVPLADLTPYVEAENLYEKCMPGTWEAGMKDGRYFYALPDFTASLLLYRRDIFEEEGLPSEPEEVANLLATWDDFIEVGKKITKDTTGDGKIDRYMMALDVKSPSSYTEFIKIFALQEGSWWNKEGEVTIDTWDKVRALEVYVDLVKKHKIAMDIGVPVKNVVRFTAMREGDVVTTFSWGWYTSYLMAEASELSGKWGAIPIPARRPGGRRISGYPGGTGFAITKQSKYPDLAWDLVNFCIFTPENVIWSTEQGFQTAPSLKTVLDNPIYNQPDPYFGGQRVGRLMKEIMKDYPPQYVRPYLREARDLISAEIYKVYSDEKTAGQALKYVADELRKLMK